jgi:hypothetical protein
MGLGWLAILVLYFFILPPMFTVGSIGLFIEKIVGVFQLDLN